MKPRKLFAGPSLIGPTISVGGGDEDIGANIAGYSMLFNHRWQSLDTDALNLTEGSKLTLEVRGHEIVLSKGLVPQVRGLPLAANLGASTHRVRARLQGVGGSTFSPDFDHLSISVIWFPI